MNYSTLHRNLYDQLAEEYEKRVGVLLPTTKEAMDYFSAYIKPGGLVLDVGCGAGAFMEALARKGFRVMGLEISPKMAEFAKRRNPGADVIVGDFLETDFEEKFDGVLVGAFIHLFPKSEIGVVFDKVKSIINPDGVVYIGSTESKESKEGIYAKEDYGQTYKRFRKFWTETELRETLVQNGFEELALKKIKDPLGKIWMDFVVRTR